MEAPSLFLSLPNDIVVNILARVPRRYYPILSCISKELRSLVRSSELNKTRSLLGKDCFYVCFNESIGLSRTYHWFTLTDNRRLVSIPVPSLPEPYAAALMVGPEIYLVGGTFNHPSRNLWILDPWSGKLRQGPSRLVATLSAAVGLVDDKIYIFGGGRKDEEIQAQVFDLKTQSWQVAPNPTVHVQSVSCSVVSPSLDKKIYARIPLGGVVMVYDPRDGQCDVIGVPDNDVYGSDLCVIKNVIYMQYHGVGLMWYNSETNEWRVVHGLELKGLYLNHVMAEYNGKLAFLWHEWSKKEIWCTMIVLDGSGVEIRGQVEWSNCILSDVPPHYDEITHYLGRTD